ncbi:MAG: hypothetical protein IT384_31555 [Deltaproteobacteria bacterium]|nr:hypothetical protein [Deltaproteobacteria bacterium]
MAQLARTPDGFRYAPGALARERAVFPQLFAKVTDADALRAAQGADNGDRYLNGTELAEGLRVAYRDQQPYNVWLKDPARTEGLVDLRRVHADTTKALRNAGRQAMNALGPRLPASEAPNMKEHAAVVLFSPSGATGAADLAYAVLPRTPSGLPSMKTDADGLVSFWYRFDPAFQKPAFYGPFRTTPAGLLVEGAKKAPLVPGGEVDPAAVQRAFERSVLFHASGTSGGDAFLPRVKIKGQGVRDTLLSVVTPELDRKVRYSASVRGEAAARAYLASAHDRSDASVSMRAILDELMSSGAIADAIYVKASSEERSYLGGHRATLVRESDVLVLVDAQGRGFGFKEGTL